MDAGSMDGRSMDVGSKGPGSRSARRWRAFAAGAALVIASVPAAAVTATAPAAGSSAGPLVLEGDAHVEIVADPDEVPAIIDAVRALAADEERARPVVVTIPWRG